MIKKTKNDRLIRVFISSTFRDMQEERDILVKQIFPDLRKRCRDRKIELVEIDLRWGITEEQAETGQTIPVCLHEVERCRPYFIGMLGDRYGWIPDDINPQIKDDQPWMKNHEEISITEMEFLYGMLNEGRAQKEAYVYFRNKAYHESFAPEKKAIFESENIESSNKLDLLKDQIINSGASVKNYTTIEEFGKKVQDDLWDTINEVYPIEQEPTAQELNNLKHECFADTKRVVYIGKEIYFDTLIDHVSKANNPVVILGHSGSGKSALVANWVEEYRESHPETLSFVHFIGATAESADHFKMIRRLLEQIKAWGLYNEEIPTDPDKMVEELPHWLAAAGAKKKILLVFDALNQLDTKGNSQELKWLPLQFPENINVVISTLPSVAMDSLKTRNYKTMEIKPFSENEREAFVRSYLAHFRKNLPNEAIQKIVKSDQTKNPLFLKTLLGELRILGVYEELYIRLNEYLKSTSIENLYSKMLARLEFDFQKEHSDLVKDTLSLIGCSRRGLSEPELLEILGTSESPLPRAYLSPLLLSLDDLLVSSGGLIAFAHDSLRIAVKSRYLQDNEIYYRERTVQYFRTKDVSDRVIDEIPWQLEKLKKWNSLHSFIRRMEVFLLFNKSNRIELLGYWRKISMFFNMNDSYRVSMESWKNAEDNIESHDRFDLMVIPVLASLAKFFQFCGYNKEALPLFKEAADLSENNFGKKDPATFDALSNLALSYRDLGKHDHAETILENIFFEQGRTLGLDHEETINSMYSLALVSVDSGHFQDAEKLYQRVLAHREKNLGPTDQKTIQCVQGLANLLVKREELDKAEILQRRAYRTRDMTLGSEHPSTLLSLNSLARLLLTKGELKEAIKLFKISLNIYEKTFGTEYPGYLSSAKGLADVLMEDENYSEAETIYRQVHTSMNRILGTEHPNTLAALRNYALVKTKCKNFQVAEGMVNEVLHIRTKTLGVDHPDTVEVMNDLAELRSMEKDYHSAEELFREVISKRQKTLGFEHSNTLKSVSGLASVLYNSNKSLSESENLFRRVLKSDERNHGFDHPETLKTLINLSRVLAKEKDYEEAEEIIKRVINTQINHLGEDHRNSLSSQSELGKILFLQRKLPESEDIYKKIHIKRQVILGKKNPATLRSARRLAMVTANQKKYEEALRIYLDTYNKQIEILGETHSQTLTSTMGLASCYENLKQFKEAERLYRVVFEVGKEALGELHNDYVYATSHLGRILLLMNKFKEASDLLTLAVENRTKAKGRDHIENTEDIELISRTQIALGDDAKAEKMLEDLYQRKIKTFGRNAPETHHALKVLAKLQINSGSLLKAEQNFQKIYRSNENNYGAIDKRTIDSLESLITIDIEKDQITDAIDKIHSVLEFKIKTEGVRHFQTVATLSRLVSLRIQIGELDLAKSTVQRIFKYSEDLIPSNASPRVLTLLNSAISIIEKANNVSRAWQTYIEALTLINPQASQLLRKGLPVLIKILPPK